MSRDKINRMNKALLHWNEITDEIAQLREEYESSGWNTVVLHPGDVTAGTVSDDSPGFRLVVPSSELEALEDLVGETEASFDEFEVYHAPTDDLTFYVVVLQAASFRRAVFLPVFYDPTRDSEITEAVNNCSHILIETTTIDENRTYRFTIEDTDVFNR
ncbi:hypothetical protein C2R22_21715 (plasmid) [Salinigranum rubrum]|uniref:Uncharacterized protein n=1 Tax=Salinigranum rubrum TaxID=755307 RepID=A0A2I8VQI7_9EURY|nr:hypothetical protein [Salinigranum rubrum]AUV84190.1 hypothetical protein C2R22_21715 [Salinigranum rubrum]